MSHSADLPEVHDEAPDTPSWIPVTGLVLLALILFWLVARAEMSPTPTSAEPAAEAAEPA